MDDGTLNDLERRLQPARRFVPIVLLKPALTAALGIDGGAIFQILATENLHLSPATIGLAFGCGLASVPLQLLAGRMPFRLARRNLRLFLALAALQSAVMAVLVVGGVGGGFAATALGITVSAEIAISILFVTAWQPLLSAHLAPRDRQRINTGWTAAGRGLLAVVLVLVSVSGAYGRAVLLASLSLIAAALAALLGRELGRGDGSVQRPAKSARALPLPSEVRWVLASFVFINLGSLPLWLIFISRTLWPEANLGAIGALQTAADVAALLAWVPTDGNLGWRAIAGAGVSLVGCLSLWIAGSSAPGLGSQVGIVIATIAVAFGTSYSSIAVLEMAHRLVGNGASVVRLFTLVDVIDSSSLQLGLLLGGLVVGVGHSVGGMTPYVLLTVVSSATAVLVVAKTSRATAAFGRASSGKFTNPLFEEHSSQS